jgi:hypothetical protein
MVKWLRDLGHSLGGLYTLLPGLWGKVVDVKDKTLSLFTDINTLISNVEVVIQDIKTFEINPKWNSRVIVAPRVVEKIQELYEVPTRIITDVKDLVSILREKLQPAEIKVSDVEGLDGVPLKLVKAGEKILGFVTLIIDALVSIESAVHDLNDIVDAVKTTLEDLKGLDALFLPQGSTKKMVDKHYRSRIKS